jgi:hypothetical protein
MIRNILGLILLFLLPSLAYLGYAALARPERPGRALLDETPFVGLAVAGLILVFATLIYYASSPTKGELGQTYTPPRIKDGQIEPGHFNK